MPNPTQMEMMMWDDHNRNRAEKMGHTCPMHPTILKPRINRSYINNDDGYKPSMPEPLPPIKIGNRFDDDDDYMCKPFIPEPAPLIKLGNQFDDDDYRYKPPIFKPTPLIKIGNRFDDDDDDGYNPFKKY